MRIRAAIPTDGGNVIILFLSGLFLIKTRVIPTKHCDVFQWKRGGILDDSFFTDTNNRNKNE